MVFYAGSYPAFNIRVIAEPVLHATLSSETLWDKGKHIFPSCHACSPILKFQLQTTLRETKTKDVLIQNGRLINYIHSFLQPGKQSIHKHAILDHLDK